MARGYKLRCAVLAAIALLPALIVAHPTPIVLHPFLPAPCPFTHTTPGTNDEAEAEEDEEDEEHEAIKQLGSVLQDALSHVQAELLTPPCAVDSGSGATDVACGGPAIAIGFDLTVAGRSWGSPASTTAAQCPRVVQ